MELSDEQKQRILQEEEARLAEEQYRAQVRRELQSQDGGPTPVRPQSKTTRNILIAVGAVVLLLVGVLVTVSHRPSTGGILDAGTPTKSLEKLEKPSPLPPAKLSTAQIADRATPSVVVVENFNEDGERAGQGSGYVHSADGVIITNYHVIRGAKSLTIRVPAKESFHIDSVLAYSIEHDVAALQVSASLPALETEALEPVKVGDRVIAIGAPLGLESTVSEGIVSAIRDAGGTHIIQTTASISPGSSGGPLFDEFGKVIGLTTSHMRDGQNLNFVIAVRHVNELLGQQRPISLAEMLEETQVVNSLPASTVSVPAGNLVQLPFRVSSQQGAVIEGTYTITGGSGRDVGVALVGTGGAVIMNSGRVSGSGQIKQRLPMGQYAVVFDNRFSTFSSKSVSADLKLVSYK
jgi:S1-C subfamily serine protease